MTPRAASEPCASEDDALAFVDGALDDAAASALEHHAERCTACRELLSELARDKVAQAAGADLAPALTRR